MMQMSQLGTRSAIPKTSRYERRTRKVGSLRRVDSVSNSPLSITWDHLGVVRERGEYSRRPQSLPSRPHHISTLRAGGGGGGVVN